MDLDELQRAWQSQAPQPPLTVDTRILLREVQRSQLRFWSIIFWRDVREVGVAVLLTLWFYHLAWKNHDWSAGGIAVGCGGVGCYMFLDAIIQFRKRPKPNQSLKEWLDGSLGQVRHQIWLLKNILWTYILPLSVPLEVYYGWHARPFNAAGIHYFIANTIMVIVIGVVVYQINQMAVRKKLEPLNKELEEMWNSLNL